MRSYSCSSSFLIVLAMLLVSPATSRAQSVAEPKSWTVTPFLGGSFGTSDDLGSSLDHRRRDRLRPDDEPRVRGGARARVRRRRRRHQHDWSLTNFSVNAIYHFDVRHVTPYATLGLGVERSNLTIDDPDLLALYPPDSNEITYNFGGGVKYPLSDRFLARADLRRFQATDLAPDHWRLYAGLTLWIKRR